MEAAAALLVAAGEVLEDSGVAVPERQVITVGPPALDCCEQVAVAVIDGRDAQIGPQDEAGRMQACMTMNLAGLRVTVTGCVPTTSESGDPPSPTRIIEASTDLYAQGWTLWCGLRSRLAAGVVFDEATDLARSYILGPLLPLPEQGGCAGFTCDVLFELPPDRTLGAPGS
jgi:hypothetical protein